MNTVRFSFFVDDPIEGEAAAQMERDARRFDAQDLVDAAEIARRLGYSRRQVVHSWHRRYREFPEPLRKLSIGYVWLWPEVERWAIHTRRLFH